MKLEEVILSAKADPIWAEAEKLSLDPEGIVSEIKDKYSRYSDSACIRLAVSAITKYVKESGAQYESVSGMILGGTDVYSKKAPITYPLISKDGKKIVKISTWDRTLLRTPAKVTVSGEFSTSYNNLIIEDVKEQEVIDPAGIAARLAKVALTVEDELEALEKYACVIIRGKVKYVRPSTRWINNEIDGAWSTWEKTEGANGVYHPVMDISLDPASTSTFVTLQLKRMHSALPTVNIEDLATVSQEAANEFPDQPKKQGEAILAVIGEREVVALGTVNSVSKKYNEKLGMYLTSVNIAVAYIEELPENHPEKPSEVLSGVGENVPKVSPKMKKGVEITDDEPVAEKKEKKTRAEKVKEASLDAPEEPTAQEKFDIQHAANLGKVSPDFKDTTHNIVALCKITKRDPESFGEKELRETLGLKMGDISIKACKLRAKDILNHNAFEPAAGE